LFDTAIAVDLELPVHEDGGRHQFVVPSQVSGRTNWSCHVAKLALAALGEASDKK
jgi:hypothetical protein